MPCLCGHWSRPGLYQGYVSPKWTYVQYFIFDFAKWCAYRILSVIYPCEVHIIMLPSSSSSMKQVCILWYLTIQLQNRWHALGVVRRGPLRWFTTAANLLTSKCSRSRRRQVRYMMLYRVAFMSDDSFSNIALLYEYNQSIVSKYLIA